MGNERGEPYRYVETLRGELFDGRYPGARRACEFIGLGQSVAGRRYGNLNVRELRIEHRQIFVLCDQRRLGNDQVADAAGVHPADGFAGCVMSAFRWLETICHAAQPQDGSGGYAVQAAGDFTDVGHGRVLRVS